MKSCLCVLLFVVFWFRSWLTPVVPQVHLMFTYCQPHRDRLARWRHLLFTAARPEISNHALETMVSRIMGSTRVRQEYHEEAKDSELLRLSAFTTPPSLVLHPGSLSKMREVKMSETKEKRKRHKGEVQDSNHNKMVNSLSIVNARCRANGVVHKWCQTDLTGF